MNLIRLAWAVILIGLISVVTCAPFYVGFGFGAAKKAEAAESPNVPNLDSTTTLESLSALVKLFPNGRFIVRDTRTILVWDATSNTLAKCFYARATRTLSQLGQQKTGYKWEQWTIGELSGEWTQEQCYATTFAKGS